MSLNSHDILLGRFIGLNFLPVILQVIIGQYVHLPSLVQ